MDTVDSRNLSPLWKMLIKNVRVDGQRHPLFAAEHIGPCLTKKRINQRDKRRFITDQSQLKDLSPKSNSQRGAEKANDN